MFSFSVCVAFYLGMSLHIRSMAGGVNLGRPAWFWLGGPRVLGRTGLVLAWGAKGPGPDRLGFGLGGQGSWAGPAWFLILRRTIIFRRSIFKKYHI